MTDTLAERLCPTGPYIPYSTGQFRASDGAISFVRHECCDSHWWGVPGDTCLFCERVQD